MLYNARQCNPLTCNKLFHRHFRVWLRNLEVIIMSVLYNVLKRCLIGTGTLTNSFCQPLGNACRMKSHLADEFNVDHKNDLLHGRFGILTYSYEIIFYLFWILSSNEIRSHVTGSRKYTWCHVKIIATLNNDLITRTFICNSFCRINDLGT